VVDADLEGIVAKHLADACHPKLARWHKILTEGTRSAAAAASGSSIVDGANARHR
jgi:hypothetical protein